MFGKFEPIQYLCLLSYTVYRIVWPDIWHISRNHPTKTFKKYIFYEFYLCWNISFIKLPRLPETTSYPPFFSIIPMYKVPENHNTSRPTQREQNSLDGIVRKHSMVMLVTSHHDRGVERTGLVKKELLTMTNYAVSLKNGN